ncbi:MAG TPA: phosphatase PAP2 family protein [Terriglobia bacterium]|nr:phosphatase PAP2 family protein [Terriglobia bacterium]
MPSENSIRLEFRLEDSVALLFFLIDIILQVFFREFRGQSLDFSDVMIVIPAVALLLAKEVVDYFFARKETRLDTGEDLVNFVRPYWRIFRDWFPFLLILLMYYSLWGKATLLLVTHDRDALLIGWDQKLFGTDPTLLLQRFISPPLTAWMQFSYAFHLYLIPIVGCFIYLRRPRNRFREMMCGLVIVTFFGILGYLIVPAIGPEYTLRNLYTVPLTQPLALFNQQIEFMNFARIQRDCFPSLHVGISFLVWLYAWRNSKRLFWILTPFVLSLWASTLYLRYHYAVDCIAGFILAPLCYWLANALYKRYGDFSVLVPLPAAWAQRLRKVRVAEAEVEEHL